MMRPSVNSTCIYFSSNFTSWIWTSVGKVYSLIECWTLCRFTCVFSSICFTPLQSFTGTCEFNFWFKPDLGVIVVILRSLANMDLARLSCKASYCETRQSIRRLQVLSDSSYANIIACFCKAIHRPLALSPTVDRRVDKHHPNGSILQLGQWFE